MTSDRARPTSFRQALSQGGLVWDGAMGTALYERGILYSACFDDACRTQPELVRKVHESYVRAGATLIGTNSFGANHYRLKTHALETHVIAINRAAVALARQAAGESAYVGGSVGPTGLLLKTVKADEHPAIHAAFVEQCEVLVAEGVDVLLLETFRQPEEIRIALEAARSVAGDVPVIASVSFDPFGTMADGTGPEEMAQRLADWGADAIGVNCADGPAGVYEMATRMLGAGRPVVAKPNAGLPHRIDGRFAYMATPEYFLIYGKRLFKAGVKAVGGCCGTTDEHVRKIAAAARMVGKDDDEGGGGMRGDVNERVSIAPGIEVTPVADKSPLGAKLAAKLAANLDTKSAKEFVISVEVNPPPGLSLDKALAGAKKLRDAGVDVINVADGARASARMGNLALCLRIQQELGMQALMHVTTRDRNVLGLVAHLLAAHELGLRNLVVITGDPPKMGDFPDATAVYDLDSVGLLRLISGLNHGRDPGGKPLGAATSFLCATGAEPAAKDYERELKRLRAKVDAGAELVMTQPVYDIDILDRFLRDAAPLGVPVLVGLLPLASYKNAEFLHNEVPGMSVPEPIRERMRKAGVGDGARQAGVEIAREMLVAVKDRVAGAYIMPPFGRYELAIDVITGVVR